MFSLDCISFCNLPGTLIWRALPLLDKSERFSISLPNAFNFSFSFAWFLRLHLVLLVVGEYMLVYNDKRQQAQIQYYHRIQSVGPATKTVLTPPVHLHDSSGSNPILHSSSTSLWSCYMCLTHSSHTQEKQEQTNKSVLIRLIGAHDKQS